MNRIISTLAVTLIAASALNTRAAERVWAAVDYMHIPEGKSSNDYVALEKIWMKLHQKAVDSGICRGWYLDQVENGGRNQYVTIRIYDSLDKMANPWPASLRENLFNSEETAKMQQTAQVRDLTRSELWELESSAMKTGDPGKPDVLYVNFMKPAPGKAQAYYKMECDTFQKIHQARVNFGEMTSWFFLSRAFPSGTDSEYDFVTVDAHPANPPKIEEKDVRPALTKEQWDNFPKVTETRTIVRREIWRPLLSTKPAAK